MFPNCQTTSPETNRAKECTIFFAKDQQQGFWISYKKVREVFLLNSWILREIFIFSQVYGQWPMAGEHQGNRNNVANKREERDKLKCQLCQLPFRIHAKTHKYFDAIRTPCGHLFDLCCLQHWLSPQNINKVAAFRLRQWVCPMCDQSIKSTLKIMRHLQICFNLDQIAHLPVVAADKATTYINLLDHQQYTWPQVRSHLALWLLMIAPAYTFPGISPEIIKDLPPPPSPIDVTDLEAKAYAYCLEHNVDIFERDRNRASVDLAHIKKDTLAIRIKKIKQHSDPVFVQQMETTLIPRVERWMNTM